MGDFIFTEIGLPGYQGKRVKVTDSDGSPVSIADFFSGLPSGGGKELSEFLLGLPHTAIFWEFPSVCVSNFQRATEFVVLDAPSFSRVTPNPLPFSKHFESQDSVVDFRNLSGDAHLVVPSTARSGAQYPHLLEFLRTAPEDVREQFWKRAGEVFTEELNDSPLWVSTAGMGVHWLHLRFDRKPKYYRFQSYRN